MSATNPGTTGDAYYSERILYWDPATGTYSIYDASAPNQRRVISGEQATRYAGQGWQIKSPTTVDPRSPDDPTRNPSVAPPPAAPAPPVSYDPKGGGPTYTPGIAFGQGVIPGHGDAYQRQWFDVGPSGSTEGLNQAYYNDPSNWNYAWDKVLNQFGGQQGGDFYKFLQGFSNTARGDYQNSVPYDPNLNVANFLDQYAPQIAGVYKLQPSAQTHGGGAFGLAGRATY